MRHNFQGLVHSYTLETTTLPAGHRQISAKWVYSWKANHLGEVNWGKARLVARGFVKRRDLDLRDAFFPTPAITMEHFHCLKAFAKTKNREILYFKSTPLANVTA